MQRQRVPSLKNKSHRRQAKMRRSNALTWTPPRTLGDMRASGYPQAKDGQLTELTKYEAVHPMEHPPPTEADRQALQDMEQDPVTVVPMTPDAILTMKAMLDRKGMTYQMDVYEGTAQMCRAHPDLVPFYQPELEAQGDAQVVDLTGNASEENKLVSTTGASPIGWPRAALRLPQRYQWSLNWCADWMPPSESTMLSLSWSVEATPPTPGVPQGFTTRATVSSSVVCALHDSSHSMRQLIGSCDEAQQTKLETTAGNLRRAMALPGVSNSAASPRTDGDNVAIWLVQLIVSLRMLADSEQQWNHSPLHSCATTRGCRSSQHGTRTSSAADGSHTASGSTATLELESRTP